VGKEPKVSKEEREAQTGKLYAKVGKIAVLGEHLNFAMFQCCGQVLEVRGVPQNYAQTVLTGQNFENMRRTWESLMKVFYAGDPEAMGMIDHLSNRLDNIIRRRNDTVHRLWFIGWGNEETRSAISSCAASAGIRLCTPYAKRGSNPAVPNRPPRSNPTACASQISARRYRRYARCWRLPRAT
jgi:hypothetical protein